MYMPTDEEIDDELPKPPIWDGNLPEGQICQRQNNVYTSFSRNIPTCTSVATIGQGEIRYYEDSENPNRDKDGWVVEEVFSYYCDNCFSEFQKFDEMSEEYDNFITGIGEHVDQINSNNKEKYPYCGEWPNCGAINFRDDWELVMYGSWTVKDLAIKQLLDESTWFSSIGRLDISIEILTYLLEELGVNEETASKLNFENNFTSMWG